MFTCHNCKSKYCKCIDTPFSNSYGRCEVCKQFDNCVDCQCGGTTWHERLKDDDVKKVIQEEVIKTIDPELERLLAEEEEIERREREPVSDEQITETKVDLQKIAWDLEKM